jgi:broad specificity phosphatase PhoE
VVPGARGARGPAGAVHGAVPAPATRLLLVRHGRAASAWGDAPDPGLDAQGRAQADAVADQLAERTAPVAIRSSPRARARETAAPLAQRWGIEVEIDPAFDEIPSPIDHPDGPAGRTEWLRHALAGPWSDLDAEVNGWRVAMVDAALRLDADTVVFTHFVAINALVSHATADDAVTVFMPGHASLTELAIDPDRGQITVVQLGSEANTEIR